MNHEHRVVGIKYIDHLKKPASSALAQYEEFVITDLLWIRRLDLPHHHFRLFPIYAVVGNVFAIPGDPPKLHARLLPTL